MGALTAEYRGSGIGIEGSWNRTRAGLEDLVGLRKESEPVEQGDDDA